MDHSSFSWLRLVTTLAICLCFLRIHFRSSVICFVSEWPVSQNYISKAILPAAFWLFVNGMPWWKRGQKEVGSSFSAPVGCSSSWTQTFRMMGVSMYPLLHHRRCHPHPPTPPILLIKPLSWSFGLHFCWEAILCAYHCPACNVPISLATFNIFLFSPV